MEKDQPPVLETCIALGTANVLGALDREES